MSYIPIVRLENKYHRGKHNILVKFEYNKDLIQLIKTIPSSTWSTTLRSWYIIHTVSNLELLEKTLNGHVKLNQEGFSRTLISRKGHQKATRQISEANKTIIRQYVSYLKGKRYSESTIKTYFTFVADFINFVKEKPLYELVNRDVELFAEQVLAKQDYAISTHRQFISALKHFIVFYPNTQIQDLELKRPRKSTILPTVLSQEEVVRLLSATKNLKHRAILGLIYSAGLRISELINLELSHINVERRQLYIKNAKGRKDRYVILAEGYLPLLQNYVISYRPKKYFVEGQGGNKYTSSSVRKFLSKSCKAAGIIKKVTPHTLRHSYATHLLENGIGLRHIQELLGHSKPETTMIYTHVAQKDLLEIKSPLDTILLNLQKNKKQEQNILLSRKFL